MTGYKVLTGRERKQKSLGSHRPQSVEQWLNSLLRINFNENVGKQSLNTQGLVDILGWQMSKVRFDLHFAET